MTPNQPQPALRADSRNDQPRFGRALLLPVTVVATAGAAVAALAGATLGAANLAGGMVIALCVVLSGIAVALLGRALLRRHVEAPLGDLEQALRRRAELSLAAPDPAVNRVMDAARDWARDLETERAKLLQDQQELRGQYEAARTAQQQMQVVLNSTAGVFYASRASGDFSALFVSDNVRKVCGYEPEQFTGQPSFWLDHVHPDDRPVILAGLTRLETDDRHVHEYRFLCADGKYRWVHDDISQLRDADGKPERLVGYWLDITERKRLEEQLRDAHKLEAIGQLTGGLAHDFNNLLGIIVGNLDLLEEHLPEDSRTRLHHQTALDAALRAAEVTRSLLAVARRQPLEVGMHDLNALLADMVPLLRASVGSDVELTSALAAGELQARLDAGGLSNIVLNLVINARDSMRNNAGERWVRIVTRIEQVAQTDHPLAPGAYAVLDVTDNGCGMTDLVRSRAFEPFFTTKPRDQGTGLGLAMVHGYATALGGTARIVSAEGQGTTVSVYLPLNEEGQRTAEQAEAVRLQALHNLHILDTPPEPEFDALVAEAARVCNTPIALVSLIDADRQWFKARYGLELSETPREYAFCARTILTPGQPMVISDALKDVRFSGNLLVSEDPKIRFYAGVPLCDASGHPLGTLCVIDRAPRSLTAVQRDRLMALAQVAEQRLRARGTEAAAGDAEALPMPVIAVPAAPERRVLVVDDEVALCDLARSWLEGLGYAVAVAHSAAEGLAALEREAFDVLFTDVVMPGRMDGIALAKEAQARWPAIHVLMASGFAESLLDQGRLPGPLLNKPYRKRELAEAIDRLIAGAAVPKA